MVNAVGREGKCCWPVLEGSVRRGPAVVFAVDAMAVNTSPCGGLKFLFLSFRKVANC